MDHQHSEHQNKQPEDQTKPGGILKSDFSKSARSNSAGSTEVRSKLTLGYDLHDNQGSISPDPSVDRLSVTWADAEDINLNKYNFFKPGTPPSKMEVRFPEEMEMNSDDEEDYSASVSAILQRRASLRKSKRYKSRRSSSPFTMDPPFHANSLRRRSSPFATSSDTAISIEDPSQQEVSQEQIFENIRLHKEVLKSVKQHPWRMARKLKLVHQAKSYIKKHQGVLQERLAQSRCTRDLLARFNIMITSKLQRAKRESANFANWMVLWESRIKEIESHFGSVVASYFTFLRWLFWVNLVIGAVLVAFVVLPEIRFGNTKNKIVIDDDDTEKQFLTLVMFEGYLQDSPLFYGFYSRMKPKKLPGPTDDLKYNIPLAYFLTGFAVYVYSFVATLRKMAKNSRMSKLSEKEDECVFSWKLFTGWDYMIGNTETAQNKIASIILSFKEALLEEAEKKKEARNWKVIFKRILVNVCVAIILTMSAYIVVIVVQRSDESEKSTNFWIKNEITIVMTLLTTAIPPIFELLGLVEGYHPRKQLRVQLARIMLFNQLNLYALIIALFGKIGDMSCKSTNLINYGSTVGCENNSTFIATTMSTFAANFTDNAIIYPEVREMCENVTVECAVLATTTLFSTQLPETSTKMTNSWLQTNAYSAPETSTITTNSWLQTNAYSAPETSTITTNSWLQTNAYSAPETSTKTTNSWLQKTSNSALETTTYSYDYDYYDLDDENYQRDEYRDIFNNSIDFSNFSNTEKYPETTTNADFFQPVNITDISSTETSTISTEDYYTSTERNAKTSVALKKTDYPEKYPETTTDVKNTLAPTMKIIEHSTTSKKEMCWEMRCEKYEPQKLIDPNYKYNNVSNVRQLNITTRKMLKKLCWETMIGQELVKLTVWDLLMTVSTTITMDFIRAVFIRFMNGCWCWDLEKTFPQYGNFKIAENILHLVSNQGMVWMGMFFSPGLVIINVVKLVILMYIRSWTVMTCNIPHEVVFRASRSNNFYFTLLLIMLFLCVIPVGYAIVWVGPSGHCGPFSYHVKIFHLLTQTLQESLPESFQKILDYVASPAIIIPLLILLILVIYYLISLTGALRETNNDLKIQLRRERTEERRKVFQMADKRRRNGSNDSDNTPYGKWKKILPAMQSNKSDTESEIAGENNETEKPDKKDLFGKIVKLALRKSSATSDEGSGLAAPLADEETDSEFHESLPENVLNAKDIKFPKPKLQKSKKIEKSNKITRNETLENGKPAKVTIENEFENKRRQKTRLEKLRQKSKLEIETKRIKEGNNFDTETSKMKKRRKSDNDEILETQEEKLQEYKENLLAEVVEDIANIPVITISKAESDESILEKSKEEKENKEKMIKFEEFPNEENQMSLKQDY